MQVAAMRRALEIRERVWGSDHPGVAVSLHELAEAYKYTDEFPKVEPLLLRAIAIAEKSLGPEDPYLQIPLHNLGLHYLHVARLPEAESHLLRALAIEERTGGPDEAALSQTLNTLASVYDAMGEYSRCESLRRRVLTARMKVFSPESFEVAQALNNLAVLYLLTGEYEKAEPLFRQAVGIWEKVSGPEHVNTGFGLLGLAKLFVARGEYAKAEEVLPRVQAIWEKGFGPENPNVGMVLDEAARISLAKGDYAKAEATLRRAIAITEKRFGAESTSMAKRLTRLGVVYRAKGDYRTAEETLQRALRIGEMSAGTEHPLVAESLGELAQLAWSRGDLRGAISHLTRFDHVSERNIARNIVSGSERRKRVYVELYSRDRDLLVSLAMRSPDPAAARLGLTALLRRKGRALDAMTDSVASLRRHAPPEGRALLDQFAAACSQLSVLTLRAQTDDNRPPSAATLAELGERVEGLQSEIGARSAHFRAQSAAVTLDAVQKAVPAGAALVEFAAYRPFEPATAGPRGQYGATRYAAFVLENEGEPRAVDLGDAAEVDAAVAQFRAALRDPKRRDVASLARALDEKVMRPVRSLLEQANHLVISPDGSLNLAPFTALVDETNRYLVERYTITYLTSGRDLLRFRESQAATRDVLVLADPNFELAGNETAPPAEPHGERARGIDLARPEFPRLPGTSDEARVIGRMLAGATVLTRERATEAALKRAEPPDVLHVATHGFFLEDEGLSPEVDRRLEAARGGDFGKGLAAAGTLENPLLRSGLALAGANRRQSGQGEDGLLTALEAAALDLWGTRLVVLSACDTGLGEVRTGEGVYGLRRALVLAGAETQVMSLWSVNDVATRDLMTGYYRGLLAGKGRGEAMRVVQLKLLANPRTAHPAHWAGFIVSGQWAPLRPR